MYGTARQQDTEMNKFNMRKNKNSIVDWIGNSKPATEQKNKVQVRRHQFLQFLHIKYGSNMLSEFSFRLCVREINSLTD